MLQVQEDGKCLFCHYFSLLWLQRHEYETELNASRAALDQVGPSAIHGNKPCSYNDRGHSLEAVQTIECSSHCCLKPNDKLSLPAAGGSAKLRGKLPVTL